MAEWETTSGLGSVERERQEIQAEIQLEALETQAREAAEALERAREHAAASKQRTPPPGDWHAAEERQVQQRVRSDGSTVFRARVAGQTSPSFDTIEQAVAWRDQQAA